MRAAQYRWPLDRVEGAVKDMAEQPRRVTGTETGNEGRVVRASEVVLRIRRQDRPDAAARWEEFAVPRRPNMNIISCLQYIAAHPATSDGRATTPVVYDSGCLEEVCGACTMLINGKTRQACSALVDKLGEPSSGVGAA